MNVAGELNGASFECEGRLRKGPKVGRKKARGNIIIRFYWFPGMYRRARGVGCMVQERTKTCVRENLLVHIATVVFGSVTGEGDDMIYSR